MVTVPIGGTIRNTVTWNAEVYGEATHLFRVGTIYRPTGTNIVYADVHVIVTTGTATNIITDVDFAIPADFPLGVYDAETYITDPATGTLLDNVIETGVLTVLPTYAAKIVSTYFTAI